MTLVVRRWAAALRVFLAEQSELQERLGLLNRPWEEDFVHWAGDGRTGSCTATYHHRGMDDGRA